MINKYTHLCKWNPMEIEDLCLDHIFIMKLSLNQNETFLFYLFKVSHLICLCH